VSSKCAIGLDIGTSGCRAVAVADDGREPASAKTGLPEPVRSDSEVAQDPLLWWQAALRVLTDLATRLGRHRPRSLCVDATSATLLLCRPNGTPTGPALMYNDARARKEAARIERTAPATSPARGPGSSLAKLLYLAARAEGDAGGLALHQTDWVTGKLLGRFGDSDWNNALKLGFDPMAKHWPDWLSTLLPQQISLPRIHPPGALLGTIAPGIAQRTGLPPDLEIRAGTTDSTAAVIAAGVREPGDAVTSLGSTLVLKILADTPVNAPDLGVYSHRFGEHWLVGGASNSGGAVLRHFFDDKRIEELSRAIDPLQDTGLDYYPLPAPGERFPINAPDLQPRLTPRPSDDSQFLHGLLEGIARIEQQGYRQLVELGAPRPRRVISIGGGARNPTWTRMRERLLGLPVVKAEHQDAAYGAALLALQGGVG